MSILEIEVGNLRPCAVAFTEKDLIVTLDDGRRISTPIAWYPRLAKASLEQRENFELMPMGVHWPDIDEDLSVAGMLKGNRSTR